MQRKKSIIIYIIKQIIFNKKGGIILFPLSWLYGITVILRNFLYNKKIKKSFYYENPKVISVGNLSLGGTGKTPLIIYLIELLSRQNLTIAVVSRGYKRKSKGFKVVNEGDSALTVGDEPYLLYTKFKYNPNISIAVGERRVQAITRMKAYRTHLDVILLDDAFQHRSVRPTLNIVLTTFNRPFFRDYLFPLGQLREPRKEIKRADMLIITKIPLNLTKPQMEELKEKVYPYHPTAFSDFPIFFTHMVYQPPISIWKDKHKQKKLPPTVLLVTGIANPFPLLEYLQANNHNVLHLIFRDHHWFTYRDIVRIIKTFYRLPTPYKAIVTTEKDSVRLINSSWQPLLSPLPLFYIPIKIKFSKESQIFFEKKICDTLLL